MTAINTVLAFAVASYSKGGSVQHATVTVIETKAKPAKVAKPRKAAKVQAAPSPNGSNALSVKTGPATVLPPVGSLGPKGFLSMMRSSKTLNEKILAIHAYCGYDTSGVFGSQEMAAMLKARNELKPVDTSGTTAEERRSAAVSLSGYVAGMPDNSKKILSDLQAREINAAEERDSHVKASRNPALTDEERKFHAGMAALEHKRMLNIRAEMKGSV